jgi:hypothetical protein
MEHLSLLTSSLTAHNHLVLSITAAKVDEFVDRLKSHAVTPTSMKEVGFPTGNVHPPSAISLAYSFLMSFDFRNAEVRSERALGIIPFVHLISATQLFVHLT